MIAIAIMHGAFAPGRDAVLARCLERIGPHPFIHVEADHERRGVWPVARDCWRQVSRFTLNTWGVVLNDDALPCEHFVEVATKALAARDRYDPVCFYTNQAQAQAAHEKGIRWLTNPDSLVGVGCALPLPAISEFLEFNERYVRTDVPFPDDARINLWAMATGRRIWTTVPSLVDHQLPDESLIGNLQYVDRRPVVSPQGDMRAIDWSGEAMHLGRKYRGSHWNLRKMLTDEGVKKFDAVRKMYALHQDAGAT